MLSVITNIHNKKTKRPTLMELFTATGKLEKRFFWQLEMFDVCTTGDTAHIDTIFKILPHTRQHECIDNLQCLKWSVFLGQRGHVEMVLCVLFVLSTKCTLHTNHSLNSCDIPTHKTTSPPERPFSHYIHSNRLAAEMWTTMKNNLQWKKNVWIFSYICTGFVNTWPTVFL